MSALTEHVRIMERAGRKVCKYCDSGNVAKKGTRKTKAGAVRLLKCCDCGRKFAYNPGFEKKRVDQKTIPRREELLPRHERARHSRRPGIRGHRGIPQDDLQLFWRS